MPTLNPDFAYKLPPERSATVACGAPFPDDWLPQLIQIIKGHLESAPSYDLATRMNEHLGSVSTYGMKEQIIEGLKAIYSVMMDENSSKDNKAAIAFKLVERAEHCTPGFHDEGEWHY